jgi:hypothetical protein
MMIRYMVYGGRIAGAGLLAGLVLPTMLRVRRSVMTRGFNRFKTRRLRAAVLIFIAGN